jgi:hypothetical protein
MVALIHLNCGPWSAPVEAPGVNRLEWTDLLFHHLGEQVEDLCVAIHRVGQIPDIGSHDRHGESWTRMRGVAAGRGPVLRIGKHSGCSKHACAKTECLLNEGAAIAHNFPRFEKGSTDRKAARENTR